MHDTHNNGKGERMGRSSDTYISFLVHVLVSCPSLPIEPFALCDCVTLFKGIPQHTMYTWCSCHFCLPCLCAYTPIPMTMD